MLALREIVKAYCGEAVGFINKYGSFQKKNNNGNRMDKYIKNWNEEKSENLTAH